jgi:hypothetical protein
VNRSKKLIIIITEKSRPTNRQKTYGSVSSAIGGGFNPAAPPNNGMNPT